MRACLTTVVALTISVVLMGGTNEARAQFSPGARSAGMAGAGLLFATGLDAVEWNPANLAWSRGWDVSLYEFGAAGLLTGTTIEDLIEIATAAGDGDASVVSRLPADGLRLSTTLEGFVTANAASLADLPEAGSPLPSVGIAVGPVALRVRSRFMADASVSREIVDLAVSGYNPERIQEYAVRNTSIRTVSFTEVTLAYGLTLGERFALGLAARSIRGHSLFQSRFFEPEVDLDAETLAVTAATVEAPGGTGYGFDVGMALDLGAGVRVSMVGSNLFQRMTWDEDLVGRQAVFSDTDFDSADIIELIDRFEEAPIEAEGVSLTVFEAARGLFRQSYFPMTIRAGLGWTHGGTSVEVVGVAVSPRGRHYSPWDERVSAGLEQRLAFLTLRGGYSLSKDGLSSMAAGLGLGLGPVKFEVGAGRFSGTLNGVDYDGAQVTIALSVRGGGS